jgi:hypothetical protein
MVPRGRLRSPSRKQPRWPWHGSFVVVGSLMHTGMSLYNWTYGKIEARPVAPVDQLGSHLHGRRPPYTRGTPPSRIFRRPIRSEARPPAIQIDSSVADHHRCALALKLSTIQALLQAGVTERGLKRFPDCLRETTFDARTKPGRHMHLVSFVLDLCKTATRL